MEMETITQIFNLGNICIFRKDFIIEDASTIVKALFILIMMTDMLHT